MRWNIGHTPIVFVTEVTPIEVVVAVVVAISYIVTLSVVILIVSTLISLTLSLYLLIGAFDLLPDAHSLHKNLLLSTTHQPLVVV